MQNLVVHRGAQLITKDELSLIQLPPETESYQPVSHYELASALTRIGRDILTDYTLVGEDYAVARQGNQMFAVLKFGKGNSDTALSVGFRNSYDRSMSIGIAIGASVFVCDNLALTGEIAVMKKHTKNVWDGLEDLAIATLYRSQHNYQKFLEDSEALKQIAFKDIEAFKLMGVLFGSGILSPRQLPVVKDEWLKPKHTEFHPRNAWSFYNACTESLKSTAPINVMEKHVNLHKVLVNGQEVWR